MNTLCPCLPQGFSASDSNPSPCKDLKIWGSEGRLSGHLLAFSAPEGSDVMACPGQFSWWTLPPKYQHCSPSETLSCLSAQCKWRASSIRNWGCILPRVRAHKPFVKFHFDCLPKGIVFACIAPCSPLLPFFFFANFKYSWAVHFILLFLDQINGSYSFTTRK